MMFTVPKIFWKPIIKKAVTGHWGRFHMKPHIPPFPINLTNAGLYLHVPFCKNLCPYCPYNRVSYEENAFASYEQAVHQEIDLYAPYLTKTKFISLYIGGGTPTVNLEGLLRILGHIKNRFSLSCDICIELHPANMDNDCLYKLRKAGVTMISLGIESTSDHILERIGRNHDGKTALDSLKRAKLAGFDSINVDLMFALPGQTISDWEQDLRAVLREGVDQISTYPLFSFPYTELGQEKRIKMVKRPSSRLVRSMLKSTDRYASEYGLERCAVWSWLRPSRKKFSSITRHHYIGFGPSAASMTGSHFYVNTFDVDAYASALPANRPVALSMPVDKRLEMAYWLYWKVYELYIEDAAFEHTFGNKKLFHSTFDELFWPLLLTGMVKKNKGAYQITKSGAYWIHCLQNEYSLNYINRLWGVCRKKAWPKGAML